MQRIFIVLAMVLGLAACDPVPTSGSGQTIDAVAICNFTQSDQGGTRQPADWDMIVTANLVIIPGSGEFPGSVSRLSNGGLRVGFTTNTSFETVEVSSNGSAVWTINFTDGGGGDFNYYGACAF